MQNKTQGVTLIELMISMAISLILLLGVVTIYISSKRGFALQEGMAEQQENGRFAIEILTKDLRMAGFPKETHIEAFIPATTLDGGGTASDSITIQYKSITDCLGRVTPANSCGSERCAINQYSISADGNLMCLGNGGGGGFAAETVAEGIVNMQIQYGVDTDDDNIANIYQRWSNVTTANRDSIVSVRFGLLAGTPDEVASVARTTTHILLDQSISTNNKRIHRDYSSTVVLRNRL